MPSGNKEMSPDIFFGNIFLVFLFKYTDGQTDTYTSPVGGGCLSVRRILIPFAGKRADEKQHIQYCGVFVG